MKSVALEDFVEIVSRNHHNKYDYSKTIYTNNYSKIEIICPIHGSFWQTPKNHYKSGCKLCADVAKSNVNFIDEALYIHGRKYNYSKEKYDDKTKHNLNSSTQFINDGVIKHNNLYDYFLVEYNHSKLPVIIVCRKHGE